MRIGIPKEVKDHEDRVGLVPSSVAELVHHGHQVIVEKGAGIGSGLSDAEYTSAGATLHDGPEAIFSLADMIKGEGATAQRAKALTFRASLVHVSSFGGRSRSYSRSPEQRRRRVSPTKL